MWTLKRKFLKKSTFIMTKIITDVIKMCYYREILNRVSPHILPQLYELIRLHFEKQ